MKDILGEEIEVDDLVVYYGSSGLIIGQVQLIDDSKYEIKFANNRGSVYGQTNPQSSLIMVIQKAEKVTELAKNFFLGKRVVVTGAIPGWSRDDAIKELRKLGANMSENVSTADIVIVTEDAIKKNTTKYQTAITHSKTVVNQKQILSTLKKKKA